MQNPTTITFFEQALYRKSGVYQIRNAISGLIYIGSASNLGARKANHLSHLKSATHNNKYLQYDFTKFGEGAFEYIVIEECSVEHLEEREQFWLTSTRANEVGVGYNNHAIVRRRKKGRDPGKAAEHKRPLRGYTHSEETKQRISKTSRGRTKSAETLRKMSESHKGQSPWNKGKSQSEHQKRRVSEALRGNRHFAGKKHSAETIEKMKQSQTARWAKRKAKAIELEERSVLLAK